MLKGRRSLSVNILHLNRLCHHTSIITSYYRLFNLQTRILKRCCDQAYAGIAALPHVQPSNSYTKKMLRSSLRRDRSSSTSESLASMEESMISKSTRLSVSFDPRVSIHEYTKPCESYIMDGWSNYFSR